MSARKRKEIKKSLLNKGFASYNSHHEMFFFCVDGKKTSVKTRLSQGNEECGTNLLGLMARQCKLSRAKFEELVDCPLSSEEYLKILKDGGHVR